MSLLDTLLKERLHRFRKDNARRLPANAVFRFPEQVCEHVQIPSNTLTVMILGHVMEKKAVDAIKYEGGLHIIVLREL